MSKVSVKTMASVLSGTVMEWYDFSLLGAMAPMIAVLFFPMKTPLLSLLAAFGVFASGFIARPIGAIFFGHIGDRLGRRTALSITFVLMAVPTVLIGLLPTFKTAGIIAPILLVILRLIQGAASSGEYPGAICFLTEIAPEKRRGLFASLSMFGVVGGIFVGMLVNSLLTLWLTQAEMFAWGWRIPFLLTLPLGLIGWYVRYRLPETVVFETLQVKQKIVKQPVWQLIRFHFPDLCKMTVLYSLGNISFYLCFFYIGTYLVSTHHISFQQASFNNVISMSILIFAVVFFGWLSDRFDRNKMLLIGAGFLLLFYYPIFILFFINAHTLLLAQIMLAIFVGIFSGSLPAVAADAFAAETRFSGVSVALNFGSSFFGGTSPLIATYLVQWSGKSYMPCVYPMVMAVLCMVVAASLGKKEKVAFMPA